MANRHSIVLDFDGTLVAPAWPEIGDWMPGAIEACKALNAAGKHLILHTARLSPVDPWGRERDPADVLAELMKVRAKLDGAGLSFIDIWTRPGKPGGDIYVDDRAERYHGHVHSWKRLTEKILARLDGIDAAFPALRGGA